MAVAGDIVANLTANTKGWSAGLRDAINPLNVFAASVLGVAGKGIAGFKTLGDELEKMALRTGVSAERLSALRYAAGQTDTSMESLQIAFVKQGKFLDDLNNKSAVSADVMRRLNVTTDQLAAKTADERFVLFADRLAQIKDVGERSAVAMKIFGKGAVDLLPLMANGAAGIESLMTQAERLGLVMSTEDATAAAAFGDSLDRLTSAGNALLVNVVGPFIPMLTEVGNRLAFTVGENAEWVKFLGMAAVSVGLVVVAVRGYTLATVAAANAQRLLLALSGPKGWAVLAVGIGIAAGAAYALQGEFESLTNSTRDNAAATSAATAATNRHAAAQIDLSKQFQAAAATYDKLTTLLRTPAEQAISDARQLGDEWTAAANSGASLGIRYEDLLKLQAKTLEDKSGFSGAFTAVTDELRILRGEITETELQFQRMAEFGVSDQQIEKLRKANAERDALLNTRQNEQEAERQNSGRISSTQTAVRDALQTPLDKFLEKAKDVTDTINAGQLTRAEGQAYLEAERQKLLQEQTPEATQQRRAALTEAITVNSDTANRQLVELLNRKGGSSIDEQRLQLERDAAALRAQTLEAMNKVAENTARPQIATRPFTSGDRR